jgi:hypothetical protein
MQACLQINHSSCDLLTALHTITCRQRRYDRSKSAPMTLQRSKLLGAGSSSRCVVLPASASILVTSSKPTYHSSSQPASILIKLCLSVQIAFTAIFALIAASVYASDRMTGTYDELYHIPVVCWALLLAAIFPVARLSGRLVDLCVCLVEICFQDFDNVHYLLMGVSAALRCDTAFDC